MEENKNRYSVTKMTEVLGVSSSAYYQWLQRSDKIKAKEAADIKLVALIRTIQKGNKGNFGTPRLKDRLKNVYGLVVNKKRIEKLLKKYGLNARRSKRFIPTTDSKHNLPVCANIMNRDFKASWIGQKWVSDITYLRTYNGWLYLTTVLDLFDRKIIGWAISKTLEAEETVVPALEMAYLNRKPESKLIFHSDRGGQYCSEIFQKTLKQYCPTVQQSMSRKGNCWDNACAESFFKTLKTEEKKLNGKYGQKEVRSSVFEYIEVYYNRKRIHSAIGYSTPEEFMYKILREKVA